MRQVKGLILVISIVFVASGCTSHRRIRIFPRCADGLPSRVLVDISCPPDGICGYSCLPDRWKS